MNERHIYIPSRLTFTQEEGVRYGGDVGEVLRHAASKEAEYKDIQRRIRRPVKAGDVEAMQEIVNLASMLEAQGQKLLMRNGFAGRVATAGLGLRVKSLRDESIVEGLLVSADTAKASIALVDESGERVEVTYAEHSIAPKELRETGQRHYGTSLTVGFEVTSAPEDKTWVLGL